MGIRTVEEGKIVPIRGNEYSPGLRVEVDPSNHHRLVARGQFNTYETGDGDYFGGAEVGVQAEACGIVCQTLCGVFAQCQPDTEIKPSGMFHAGSLKITGAQVANGPCRLKNRIILQSNFLTRDSNPATDYKPY